MTRRNSQLLENAYHEAGHADAALALGYRVRRVSIISNNYSEGRLVWDSPLRRRSVRKAFEFGDADKARKFKRLIEHCIIVALAGSFALRRHNPRARWRYGLTGARRGEPAREGTDEQAIQELISRLYEDRKVAKAFRQYLESRTEALVSTDWEEIERLARALYKHKMLEGVAIERAMRSPEQQAKLVALGLEKLD
jgi:hypothetical protein